MQVIFGVVFFFFWSGNQKAYSVCNHEIFWRIFFILEEEWNSELRLVLEGYILSLNFV